MVAGLRPHLVDEARIFRRLRDLEAFLSGHELSRRIGHRLVEPQPVEIVAEIVVRGDIAPGLAPRVAAQRKPRPLEEPQQAHAWKAVVDVVAGDVDEIHEGLQVRGRPAAVKVGLGEAHVAFADQPGEKVGVVYVQFGDRTGPRPSARKRRPSDRTKSRRPASIRHAVAKTGAK